MDGGRVGAGAAPLRSSLASLGTFLIAQTSGPAPSIPAVSPTGPGGRQVGPAGESHATPNEQPRPHHAVRILLTFWLNRPAPPDALRLQPRRRRSVPGATPGGCRLPRALARRRPQAPGTGPQQIAAVGAAPITAGLLPARRSWKLPPPAQDFPERVGEICGPQRSVGRMWMPGPPRWHKTRAGSRTGTARRRHMGRPRPYVTATDGG